MSKTNWYDTDSWYAPLRTEPAAAEPKTAKTKKGLTPARIIGLVALVLTLIVASSLVFSQLGKGQTPTKPEDGSSRETLPENWTEFFESYYESVQTDTVTINIPRGELQADFTMELEPAGEEELSLQQLYERCADAVVAVAGYEKNKAGFNWGTGVIISEDGLILTNTHVIDGCDSAQITLRDDTQYDARLIGADAISDIALLKIEARGLKPAVFGESGALTVGDRVAAIGNPLGETFRSTLTDGIISAIERGITYNGHSMTLLQTNTALNEGNSGGALFNMYGQAIGITNMKMMSSYSSIEGIGFAIPSSTVREVVNSLARYGEMRGRPSIGITVGSIPATASSHYKLPEGLYVSEVSKGSDAEKQGIRTGDIILQVNHIPVTKTQEVNDIKNQYQVGDSLLFTIWREGETLEISVLLMDTNDIYGK